MFELSAVENWLTDQEIDEIYSSAYWNDLEVEKKKSWWILDDDKEQLLNHLCYSGLMTQYQISEKYLISHYSRMNSNKSLQVADLAAGIGWTSSLLSKLPFIDTVHSVEISKHRITSLFEKCVRVLEGNPLKIRRYIGSFYDLKLKSNSLDIVFLSQAFHHANHPLHLLFEVDRVLSKHGIVLLMGENLITMTSYMKRIIKVFLQKGVLKSNFYQLFPPDDTLGDHYYRISDYYLFFQLLGYRITHETVGNSALIVIAEKL